MVSFVDGEVEDVDNVVARHLAGQVLHHVLREILLRQDSNFIA